MTTTNGILPPSWRSVALREVLDRIEAGTSFKAQDRPAVDGEVGVLKLSAVTWSTFQPSENKALFPGCDPGNCPQAQKGDLLISRANTTELIAAVVMVQEDHPNLLLSDKTLRLVPNKAVTCPNYLLHVLRTPLVRRHFERNATGTSGSMRNISQENIGAAKIPLPPLLEQRRIAAILDKADAIRRKREEGIRLTEELLRSTFLEMFGDPPTNPVKPLADVAAVVSGVTKGRKLNGRGASVPYLRVANVQDGYLKLDEIKTIEALPEEVEALALQRGDIVMTEGGDYDKLGRGAIWNTDIPNCIHQNHIFRVRVDQTVLVPDYFAALLRTAHAKAYFLRCAKKTTNLASINMTQLKGLPVPLPPIDKQRRFENVVNAIGKMSEARKHAAAESGQLFSSLVQRAFRGEL